MFMMFNTEVNDVVNASTANVAIMNIKLQPKNEMPVNAYII